MDCEEAILNCDILFREVANPQIKQDPVKATSKSMDIKKVEFQTLRLSDASQKRIWDTLKHIHGPDFKLDDESKYVNKNKDLSHQYWVNSGNLVIKGACNYSQQDKDPLTTTQRNLRMFAASKLESYGFHANHCHEALDHAEEDVDKALDLLYAKYFKLEKSSVQMEHGQSPDELLEMRTDEKSVLESIYESAFTEKELNKIWIVRMKLDYLVNYFGKDPNNSKNVNYNRAKIYEKLCKNYLKGYCKYGERCKFLHELKQESYQIDPNNDLFFDIEIRFHDFSQYPYEEPMILLQTNSRTPKLKLLAICKRLLQEAKSCSESGLVSVYSICELIQNEEEIKTFLETHHFDFPSPNDSLFLLERIAADKAKVKGPSHHTKGVILGKNRKTASPDELRRDDISIRKMFLEKPNNDKYRKMLRVRRNLPAHEKADDILQAVESSQVIVICGETGCGKSTQVPQFILDNWLMNFNDKSLHEHVEIICTQPRRISAIGVAERVAEERCERVGQVVGYQIRLENKISNLTRLTFCTTGILLRRLQLDPMLTNVTHIVVDEVHERSEESDFLLLILKQLLPHRPTLRVILMSATLNAQLFSSYFSSIPVLEIAGRTHPVESLFLEDILEFTDYTLEEGSEYARYTKGKSSELADLETELETLDTKMVAMPKESIKDENLTMVQVFTRYQEYNHKTCKNIYMMEHEKINYELIETILAWIAQGNHDYPNTGTVLVFLPGIGEIMSLYEKLIVTREFSPKAAKFLILPLHSTLTTEEQSAIFKKPNPGVRKIILSTNIAETSITIDDCVFVIDCGKMKEKRFDSNKNMESLDMVWISRANAMQRKGRAGRVMAGVCIHLYTKNRFQHQFIAQPIPEIQRISLEQLLLNIKILPNFDNMSLYDVLDRTLEPPHRESIEAAIRRLNDVGALDKDEELTPLGRHLAELPVDVRIGKLMLFGTIFCCLDSALTIAACLSYKSPFVAPFGKKNEADKKKKCFSVASSDQLTTLKAYKKWLEMLSRSSSAARVFANENFLSERTMFTIMDIKHQLLELLVSIGFVPMDVKVSRRSGQDKILSVTGKQINENGDNCDILAAVLCAALYPNVIKVLTPEKSYMKSITGAVPKQSTSSELKYKTKADGYVHIHPSSVNFSTGKFSSPYLVFQEKIKTSKLFVKDTSMVPMIPLILFSGCNLIIERYSNISVLSLEDGWIMFQVETHEVAEMIKAIREELIALLEEKIRDPLLNLLHHENGQKLISTITRIISGN